MASLRPTDRRMGLGEIAADPNALRDPRAPLPAQQPGMPHVAGAPPTSGYTSPLDLTGTKFLGRAPGATPYGDFVAPDPSQLGNDPYFQFRMAEGEKGVQRDAAARGTLLNTGTLKALERYRSGLAGEEGQNAFNRALAVYGTNRDTNAQNFGQATTQFRGDLDIFGANRDANESDPGSAGGAKLDYDTDLVAPVTRYGPSMGDYASQVAAARTALLPTANMAPAPTGGRKRPLNPLDWMSTGLYDRY